MWRNEVSPLHRGSVEGILTRRWRARGRHYWQMNRIWRRPPQCLCTQTPWPCIRSACTPASEMRFLSRRVSSSSFPFCSHSCCAEFVRTNFFSCAGNTPRRSACHKASMCSASYFFTACEYYMFHLQASVSCCCLWVSVGCWNCMKKWVCSCKMWLSLNMIGKGNHEVKLRWTFGPW